MTIPILTILLKSYFWTFRIFLPLWAKITLKILLQRLNVFIIMTLKHSKFHKGITVPVERYRMGRQTDTDWNIYKRAYNVHLDLKHWSLIIADLTLVYFLSFQFHISSIIFIVFLNISMENLTNRRFDLKLESINFSCGPSSF